MKVEHHVRAFEQLLKSYDGVLPLHRYLFTYFKQNKQMGSSDRRWATRYIYSFFRLGKALSKLDNLERLAIADFLCHDTTSLIISKYLPKLEESISKAVNDKITLVKKNYPTFKLEEVFPFNVELSDGIEKEDFYPAFFVQPDLFIRVKETHIQAVINQLKANEVSYKEVSSTTLALPNGTKLEQVINDLRLYQIQDLSSQQTGAYYEPKKYDYWWDCCAASGGKSLLLHSLEPNIELLVSDVRENSLSNLQERFLQSGIKKYHLKVIDLLQNNDQILHHYEFDGILLDAPCSGSGTWRRTPEMLYYFEKYKIENYVKLQKAIAANVVKYLKPGKPLIYMTCSVFKAENEDVVNYLVDNFDLKLEKMELIKGYTDKADSMFVARLIKQEKVG
ncbi:RsmB/NOP family class I SAM-dependent RNA methyltransferase [Pedobacter sp. LMG 31464]|uniref:RsmB/NOP family class I SAM-dependent RNA methyltransferase n=1 Tax=Pedobacter planticolens TaxID=2679964 RepID=A0A923IWS6_9SPHI|nr:RsmB/NOP family class I SAM-dependent RNA methyltransferase [Pedobacter planticolens]MBB2147223.1 RsmB/NOP family class I SAM-dependent RNA methyltransferase [Pedobacter planticolens]